MKYTFLSILGIFALSISAAKASLPAPVTAEQNAMATILYQIEEIYIYRDTYLSETELAENTYEFGPLEFAHHKIAVARIENSIEEALNKLNFKHTPKIILGKPNNDAAKDRLEISYTLDSTKVIVADTDIISGSIIILVTLGTEVCTSDEVCFYGYTVALNPESFILTETLNYEFSDEYKNLPEDIRSAVIPQAKIERLNPSFEKAIETSARQLKEFLGTLLKLGATQH